MKRMKRMLKTISNEGSSGKSMIAKLIKETLMNHGVAHSTYLCDKDHIELVKTYGAEVTMFDIRQDKETLINALGDAVDYVLVDFPAASIDELVNVFGSMQTFIDSFAVFDAEPTFVIPVVSDKSIQSIQRLSNILRGVQGGYQFIFVINEGLMSNKASIMESFTNDTAVQSALNSGIAHTVTISTKFTPNFAELVRTEKLRSLLTTKLSPMDKVLMIDLLKKSDDQFSKVLGLPPVKVTPPKPVKI